MYIELNNCYSLNITERGNFMLTYSFENTGSDSMYEYLYKCIRDDILKHNLTNGYKLPSKRNFAKNLGISTITVENAYEQLIAEGYIYSIPKKGYYVSDISQILIPAYENEFKERNADISVKSPVYKNLHIKSNPSDNCFADLASNRINADNFPFYTWSKLMKEIMADRRDALLQPSPSEGIYELRAAICSHLKEFRGMNVHPEQIIIGAGTEYLYTLIIQLLGRDKTFAVEDPGYEKIRKIYNSNNVKCVSIPIDEEGVNIDALKTGNANILHLSPSHHYPTGIVTPIGRRYEILGWALNCESRYIIEDDYDSEFRLLGKPIPSLESIDVSGKVIYMNTFTKTLSPTIRISYMVLPVQLMQLFKEKLNFYACTVSNFEQYTLAAFINKGYFEKHINRTRILYRRQRDMFIDAINKSPLSSIITIHEENAGLHFLLHANTTLSDEKLIERAMQRGLKISCLSEYYADKSLAIDHTLVINYSALSDDKINESIDKLYQCLTD